MIYASKKLTANFWNLSTNSWAEIYQDWCVCPYMGICFWRTTQPIFVYEFRRPLAVSRTHKIWVLGMLRWYGIIWPKVNQIWAWLHRRHWWAFGVHEPLNSLVTGPSLLDNCLISKTSFTKKTLNSKSSIDENSKTSLAVFKSPARNFKQQRMEFKYKEIFQSQET